MSAAAKELAHRFREVTLNGEWVSGTNLKKLLSEISLTEAVHSIENINSIADLTAHLHYYISGVLRVIQGGELDIRDKDSFNHKRVSTQEEWDKLRTIFITDSELFASSIEKMTDEMLQAAFAGKNYGSWERNINAMIEHCYYHQGQISLLRKMMGDKG